MNRFVSALFVASVLVAPAHADQQQFCNGFKSGYKAGYMRAAQSSLPPLPPLCPLQPLKSFGDPKSDFEHGYAVGFETGLAEGR